MDLLKSAGVRYSVLLAMCSDFIILHVMKVLVT